MISCVLIDGLLHEEPRNLLEFQSFCQFFGRHLQDFPFFDKIYFATHTKIQPEYKVAGIEYISLPRLTFNEYQLLSVYQLHEMFQEDFVVTCQLDGFPFFVEKWSDEFLDYDYIGAPWSIDIVKHHLAEHYYDEEKETVNLNDIPVNYMVGNSGFCLRSRKFLETSAKSSFPLHLCPIHSNHLMTTPKFDDWFFSFTSRSFFELRGIKFAPVDVASRFSLEAVGRELGNDGLVAPVYSKDKDGYKMDLMPIQQCIDRRLSFGYHGRPALGHLLGVTK